MNPVIIEGRVKNKKRVEEYIHALAKELGINRLYSKGIFVKFYTKLDHGAQGLCWGDHKSHAEISIARTSNGDAFTLEEMMQTLAHEMVHAKQYLRRELCGYSFSWKGRKPRNYKYENAPWEKEAYGLEEELFNKHWSKS
jgi:hypothetical protein